MDEIKEITDKILEFRDERDWSQFHNAKDLALAISIEAGELNECFLWKDANQANEERVREELADIMNYCFLLADKYKFDVKQIIFDKIEKNNQKYPTNKSKGTSKKYNEL
ncbi:MAG: nucleotide pyrophosphohydrolase [Bacteroidales bacterium]|nr:nucleotide pyrophosphohydrolase [Bacteroidales bacterium]